MNPCATALFQRPQAYGLYLPTQPERRLGNPRFPSERDFLLSFAVGRAVALWHGDLLCFNFEIVVTAWPICDIMCRQMPPYSTLGVAHRSGTGGSKRPGVPAGINGASDELGLCGRS